jgi:hypothetical protein
VPGDMTSWRLTDDRARFEPEPLSSAGAAQRTSSVGGKI